VLSASYKSAHSFISHYSQLPADLSREFLVKNVVDRVAQRTLRLRLRFMHDPHGYLFPADTYTPIKFWCTYQHFELAPTIPR
jgi:hypothetical protein